MRGNAQVLWALNQLSNTVKDVGRGGGQHDINMANVGLRGARQDYDIGRQKRSDQREDELYEIGRPEREFGKQQTVAAQEAYNRPLTSSDLIRSAEAAELMLWPDPKTGKVNIDKFAEDLNYDADASEPGIIRYFHKGTGKPVIHGEAEKDILAWGAANFSGKRGTRAKKERLEYDLAEGKINQDEYNKGMTQIQSDANDPTVQIQKAQTRMQMLSPYRDTTWAKKRIEKDELRIQQLQDALRKENAADRRAAAKTKAGVGIKDTRSTLQKNAQYMASIVPGLSEEKALEKLMGDKKASAMVSAFVKAVDAIPMDIKYNPDKKLYAAEVKRLSDAYGIEKFVGTTLRPQSETAQAEKTIVKTGKTKDGRKVVQYSDGSIEYAN